MVLTSLAKLRRSFVLDSLVEVEDEVSCVLVVMLWYSMEKLSNCRRFFFSLVFNIHHNNTSIDTQTNQTIEKHPLPIDNIDQQIKTGEMQNLTLKLLVVQVVVFSLAFFCAGRIFVFINEIIELIVSVFFSLCFCYFVTTFLCI
jgi:hypothetical protein